MPEPYSCSILSTLLLIGVPVASSCIQNYTYYNTRHFWVTWQKTLSMHCIRFINILPKHCSGFLLYPLKDSKRVLFYWQSDLSHGQCRHGTVQHHRGTHRDSTGSRSAAAASNCLHPGLENPSLHPVWDFVRTINTYTSQIVHTLWITKSEGAHIFFQDLSEFYFTACV